MKAIGMIVVVMMVSGLRVMWRRDRPCRTAVSPKKCLVIVVPYSSVPRCGHCQRVAVLAAGTDDGEEDVLEGRLLLDVFDLGGREQLLELGEGAVGDDPTLVEDRDPVGELFGLVQILRREQHRRAVLCEFLDGLPHLDARLGVEPGRRLVEEDHRRIPDEAHRDVEAAAHATRIGRHLPRGRIGQREPIEQVIGDRARSLRCRNRATSTRFSRPLRISSTAANCPVRLMDARTSAAWVATSKPLTLAAPASPLSSVDRIFTTVVLPAPFGPSRAKMPPRATSKSTPRSASSCLYDFSRPCTRIAGSEVVRAVIGTSLPRRARWRRSAVPAPGSHTRPSRSSQPTPPRTPRALPRRSRGSAFRPPPPVRTDRRRPRAPKPRCRRPSARSASGTARWLRPSCDSSREAP